MFWTVLAAMLAGKSLAKAAEGSPMSLESLRGACRRLGRRIDAVRAALCRVKDPPGTSSQPRPILQTLEHLQSVFGGGEGGSCPLGDYQIAFQKPLMG